MTGKTIKILSLVLAVMMLFSALPLTAYAAETDAAATGVGGDIGDCTWTYNTYSHTLTITGNGEMPYDIDTMRWGDCPWESYKASIQKVVIGNGVKNITPFSFYKCNAITEVQIGTSVEEIGESAFAFMNLSDLTLPDSVRKLGGDAFAFNENLTHVRMSKNIEWIGSRAFYDSDIHYAVIPKKDVVFDTDGEGMAFGYKRGHDESGDPRNDRIYGFKLAGIPGGTVEKQITDNYYGVHNYEWKFVAVGGKTGACDWFFDEETDTLTISGDGSMGDYSYSNPAPWQVFKTAENPEWTLVFDGNVTKIGDYAFYHLPIKGSVMLPYTCTSVGQSAFCYCGYIESVSCENVESFGAQAFSGCESLTNVNFDAAKTIGDSAFNNCYNLNTVMFGSNLTDIGDYAFQNTNQTSIFIPASVVTIGESAFNSIYNLEMVTFAENSKLKKIGGHAFQYARYLYSVAIPDSVTEIGDYAFAEIKTLSDLTLGSSVQTIGDGAFYRTDIHMVKCPASLQTIGARAFGYKASEHDPDLYETTGRFDFYGPPGSPAKAYADQEDDFYFHEIAMHTLTDEETGVQVYTLEENVQLVVEEKETGSIVIEVDGVIYGVYDISLQRDETPVQPEEPVTVRIPCDYYGAKVYRVEADGTLTDMNAENSFGYVEFTTDHFSLYVVTKPVEYYLGDADWDDNITAMDATKIQRHLAEMLGPNDPINKRAADVDGDGEVTILDVTIIQRYLAQFSVAYPIGEPR